MKANKKSARYNPRSPKFNKHLVLGTAAGSHKPTVRFKKPWAMTATNAPNMREALIAMASHGRGVFV